MSITSRINEMSSHIEQAYDELQGLGADLTNVNKNIENISMVLDDIYDSMPQVSGEGTSLTLDDTRVGKIKSTLKGNTSQTTYSGKNLLGLSNGTNTSGGLTITRNNGLITFTGTASVTYPNTGNVPYTLGTGTYTISSTNNTYDFYLWFRNTNNETIYTANLAKATKTITITTNDIASVVIGVEHLTPGTSYNLSTSIQIESGNSATSYEPYVGGTTSPNPSYPQPVNVVSGDNEIQVCGKNLLPNAWTSGSISGSTGQVVNYGSRMYTTNKIILDSNTTYCFKHNNTSTWSIRASIDEYDKNNNHLGRIGGLNGSANGEFTTQSNTKYINITIIEATDKITYAEYQTLLSNGKLQPMLNVGSSATTYEPYQGNTYNIDLPVENLLPDTSTTQTINGVTFTRNDNGTITINGTASYNADYYIYGQSYDAGSYLSFKKGKYSMPTSQYKNGVLFIAREKTVGAKIESSTESQVTTLMNTQDCYFYGLLIRVEQGTSCNNIIIEPQLEKGSKANSYTPYGTTPIELCKIGNYQDYFGKSDGRNLFDKSTITTSAYLKEDGTLQTGTGAEYITSDFIPVKPNTTYYKTQTLSPRTKFYDKNKQVLDSSTYQDISIGGNAGSFTTPNNAYYFRFTGNVNTSTGININTTMVNEGFSATPYQPYGVGKWYLHKEIGKIDISNYNNTEPAGAWSGFEPNGNICMVYNNTGVKITPIRNDVLSNRFTPQAESMWNGMRVGIQSYANDNKIVIGTTIAEVEEYAGTTLNVNNYIGYFKTYIISLKPDIYIILATPTTTEITYQPLIDQLNLLEKAMSKDGQTNISQVNNDLPFIISASALKEWQESTSLNSTLSMVNPLSLGNTLNTQENDIQPIEVDNIEPLEEEENEEN